MNKHQNVLRVGKQAGDALARLLEMFSSWDGQGKRNVVQETFHRRVFFPPDLHIGDNITFERD
jgi:hypothetical protein